MVNDRVLGLRAPDADSIAAVILEWTLLSVITKSEHDRLTTAGLGKKMPDDWDQKDLRSRYDAVGISLVENRYKELKKKYAA